MSCCLRAIAALAADLCLPPQDSCKGPVLAQLQARLIWRSVVGNPGSSTRVFFLGVFALLS